MPVVLPSVPYMLSLLKLNNALLAPHNSNSSPVAWERVHWNSIRNRLDGLNISSEDPGYFAK